MNKYSKKELLMLHQTAIKYELFLDVIKNKKIIDIHYLCEKTAGKNVKFDLFILSTTNKYDGGIGKMKTYELDSIAGVNSVMMDIVVGHNEKKYNNLKSDIEVAKIKLKEILLNLNESNMKLDKQIAKTKMKLDK